MNALLSQLLADADMSHAGLARRVVDAAHAEGITVSYDHTSVVRWVRGQRPRGRVPDLICAILGERLGRTLTYADIGMAAPSGDDGEDLARLVERTSASWRAAPRYAPTDTAEAGPAAIAPVWEWEHVPVPADTTHSGRVRVTGDDVGMLLAVRTRYEQAYRRVGGIATGERLRAVLADRVAPLVRGTYTASLGRDLLRASGALAALAGVCAYDTGDHRAAQVSFQQALRLAAATGDRAFGAYVVALLTNQALALARWRTAVAFADAGLRHATSSPALAADLAVMQARAYAAMGAASDTMRAVAAAETAAERLGAPGDVPEAGYVQPGMVLAKLAEVHLGLGDLVRAADYAEQAVDADAHPRCATNRLATLATIALASRDIDRAADAVARMLDYAAGMESARLRSRFTALRTELLAVDAAPARAAAERLGEWLTVP